MLRATLLLALVALACQAAPAADDQLYKSVIVGDYSAAISQSKDLDRRGKGDVISKVVDQLIEKKQRNVMDFAYQLWNSGSKDLVKHYFPLEIRIIVGDHTVKIVGYRDNMVLKLDANVDSLGDRAAFGDRDHNIGDRMAWKIIPIPGSPLYFYIYNPHTNQYLKVGVTADSDNDHRVYGDAKKDSKRHEFYFVPAKYNNEVLFFIINHEYEQGLKLGRALDSDGDRIVYSESSDVLKDPYAFGFKVAPLY